MIAKICDASTDKNIAGVEKVDQARQHIPDHLPAIANDVQCSLISFPASRVDIFRPNDASIGLSYLTQNWAASVASCLHRLGRDRGSGCHCLQTSFVSTCAQWTIFIHTDMTNIAR